MTTTPGQDLVTRAALAAGASPAEAEALGEIAGADDAADALFAPRYQTEHSPVHRAIWDGRCPVSLFDAPPPSPLAGRARAAMDGAMEAVGRHQRAGSYVDVDGPYAGKLSDALVADLGRLGYYGALIPEEYGGLGLDFPAFALEATRMSIVAPAVATQNSVHETIGAVGPLLAFGDRRQKEWLRRLATGRPQGCFALTEAHAGSDIKNLRTRGVIDGGEIVLTGQKWFITNVYPGGLMCLVCRLEGPGLPPSPQVALVELPEAEDGRYWLTRYRLTALKELRNYGVNFDGLRVPLANWIRPANAPDGLTIAYHLLNRGRVMVCAAAAGRLRALLAHMRLWGRTRISLGQPIDRRDLPLEDYARLAGLIVCADALRDWTAWLLQQGYRGELEAGAAKVTVTRLLAEAADRIYPQFWGGRALDAGHPYALHAAELKAPEIYEGHNNMLALAWFAALTKRHSRQYLLPLLQRQEALGIREVRPLSPAHAWALRAELRRYGAWIVGRQVGRRAHEPLPAMAPALAGCATAAIAGLREMALVIDQALREHREDLINRQGVAVDLALEAHQYAAMLVTALHARHAGEPTIELAAQTFCEEQLRRLRGGRRTREQHARLVELGRLVRDGAFSPLDGVPEGELVMPW
jgi:alkylation response protein AidB-like acyl-CoA dehydrogenase